MRFASPTDNSVFETPCVFFACRDLKWCKSPVVDRHPDADKRKRETVDQEECIHLVGKLYVAQAVGVFAERLRFVPKPPFSTEKQIRDFLEKGQMF